MSRALSPFLFLSSGVSLCVWGCLTPQPFSLDTEVETVQVSAQVWLLGQQSHWGSREEQPTRGCPEWEEPRHVLGVGPEPWNSPSPACATFRPWEAGWRPWEGSLAASSSWLVLSGSWAGTVHVGRLGHSLSRASEEGPSVWGPAWHHWGVLACSPGPSFLQGPGCGETALGVSSALGLCDPGKWPSLSAPDFCHPHR